MTYPRATLIISVYKDVDSLSYIFDALELQTCKDFDIIVSEDGESLEMKNFLTKPHDTLEIKHLTQPDIGWTKNIALNKSILTANNNYLIFIDGDCIPHSKFIETHITLAKQKTVLSGKRVHIGQAIKKRIDQKIVKLPELESPFFYLKNIHRLDDSKSLEDAFYARPYSFFERHIVRKFSKTRGILGCNFSCFKQDILDINGFDEDYCAPNFGEDTDLEWRFKKIGVSIQTVRNMAILYHFRHPVRKEGFESNKKLMQKKMASGEYFPTNGINKSSPRDIKK